MSDQPSATGRLRNLGSALRARLRQQRSEALPFDDVLLAELEVIDTKRGRTGLSAITRTVDTAAPDEADTEEDNIDPRLEAELEASRKALRRDLTGLAFSGGGIRSATFNLGILQALSDLRLLPTIDYLSTVSGGGYIGSWLTALIERENRRPVVPGEPHGIDAVQERLQVRRYHDQPAEDPAVGFLRQYSNYLTPRLGLLSADTWAMVATYLRNLLLNLLVLLPGLALFLLLPWLVFAVTGWVGEDKQLPNSYFFWLSIGLGVVATAVMGCSMAALVGPIKRDETEDLRRTGWLQPRFLRRALLFPLTVAAFLASCWLPELPPMSMARWAGSTAIAYGGAWLLAAVIALAARGRGDKTLRLWAALIASAALCGAAAGPLLALLAGWFEAWDDAPTQTVWGPPLVLMWLILLGTVHTGIMGRAMHDRQREWMSRLGAWLLIFALGWAALFGAVVHGPVLLLALAGWAAKALGGGWLAATLSGLLASRKKGGGEPGLVRGWVIAVTPYIFIAGLLLLIALGLSFGLADLTENKASWRKVDEVRQTWHSARADLAVLERRAEADDADAAEAVLEARKTARFADLLSALQLWHDEVINQVSKPGSEPRADDAWPEVAEIIGLTLLLLGITLFLAWRVDINEFSMHSFYRNRLVRAYLGASVDPGERHRLRQPFTGFYRGDDLPLAGSRVPLGDSTLHLAKPGPIQIINTALNMAAGEQLAWQERKAASFVLTPLFCGFQPPDETPGDAIESAVEQWGYRPTLAFASQPERQRLTLGSAFAISGAAASPNMGFRTTAAFAFLLTVFNVRLGWWLGNPRHRRTWRNSGPQIALLHLLQEVSGRTRGRTPYVYLSDGGHFENLGIYELVRRRCRFIIACDGGADPEIAFDDLGNAIRKCRSDLGADIELDLEALREGAEGTSERHCAIGKIHYLREREEGRILYIKATVSGDESADILNYRRQHASFPHTPTSDQFFDESQFECYRQLGHHVGRSVLEPAVECATDRPGAALLAGPTFRYRSHELGKLWRRLEERWLPPAQDAGADFIRHACAVDGLLDRIRQTPELAFLDSQVYPEWHRLMEGTEVEVSADTLWLPDTAAERRHGFYFCVEMLQLMENIYIDLDFDTNWNANDNSGWMSYFHHWSWSGMFRVTWAITAATFGQRFQSFCRDRLGMALGRVVIRRLPCEAAERQALARGGEHAVAAAEAALARAGKSFLNFNEREQIALYLGHSGTRLVVRDDAQVAVPAVAELLQIELVVPGAEGVDRSTSELLRFGIGYALLDQSGRLLLFRVQDHLRGMGLGTKALRAVVEASEHETFAKSTIGWAHDFWVLTKVISREAERGAEDAPARRRFADEFGDGGERLVRRLRAVLREVRERNGS